jgi:hypothetical protein
MTKLRKNSDSSVKAVANDDLLAFVRTEARAVRRDLADTIEEIGQAMGLLRESIDDADRDHLVGSQMCASDALEILSGLETKFSQLAAKVASFSEANVCCSSTGCQA